MPNIRRGMMAAAGASGGAEYQLWVWGVGSGGRLGFDAGAMNSSPVQVGDNFFGQIDLEDEGLLAIQNRMYCSYASSAVIKGDGTLWTFGSNSIGKLGVGDTIVRSSPTQVGSLTDWKSICITYSAMCATKTDGTLWGWGKGNVPATYPECSGQEISVCSPVQIGTDTDWSGVLSLDCYAGYSVVALKTNGEMYMWGNTVPGFMSQNGFGGVIYSVLPWGPIDDKNYVNVGAGKHCVWAIENTGKLWSWGVNTWGVLGHGNKTSLSSPVQIGSATDWVWVSGDKEEQQIGAKSNGEIWTCGKNEMGSFGVEDTISYSSPIQVGGPGDWQSGGHGLASGTTHLITDENGDNTGGELWTVGADWWGEQGTGSAAEILTSSPVQVGSDTNWIAVTKQGAAANYWKLAIKRAE